MIRSVLYFLGSNSDSEMNVIMKDHAIVTHYLH